MNTENTIIVKDQLSDTDQIVVVSVELVEEDYNILTRAAQVVDWAEGDLDSAAQSALDKALELQWARITKEAVASEGWIPVQDKLPDPQINVLAVAHGNAEPEILWHDGTLWFHEDGSIDFKGLVTHWQHLPGTSEIEETAFAPKGKACRECGCTDENCLACVAKTGVPCHWVEPDLCSACAPKAQE